LHIPARRRRNSPILHPLEISIALCRNLANSGVIRSEASIPDASKISETPMSAVPSNRFSSSAPVWLIAVSLGGIAWNLFGAFQFGASVTATEESLIASGLSAEQAAVMTGYPAWMSLAFAVGVFGGLAGSALLLMRRGAAMPVLGVSLAAYVALWIGDAAHGVFAAMGASQIVIVSVVVAIAAALFAVSRHPAAKA
jgi:hypothetical protein